MMSVTDIGMTHGGMTWQHRRSYDNHDLGLAPGDALNGACWDTEAIPVLESYQKNGNAHLRVVFSPGNISNFDKQDDGFYRSKSSRRDTLYHDLNDQSYVMLRTSGDVWRFYNFDQTDAPKGYLKSIINASGTSLEMFYNLDGTLQRTCIATVTGMTVQLEELRYTYLILANGEKRIDSVTSVRSTDNGSTWQSLQRVLYDYYLANNLYGMMGDLKSTLRQTMEGNGWVDQGGNYYCYYRTGDAKGGAGLLKYEFNPNAYAVFKQYLNGRSPDNATEVEIASYASKYFEYDLERRVVVEKVDGGKREYSLKYTDYPGSQNANTVSRKTEETFPNGSKRIVFTNCHRSIILSEFVPPVGSPDGGIVDYFKFDEKNRRIMHASADAVHSHELITNPDGTRSINVMLHDHQGVINHTEYYQGNASQPQGKKYQTLIQNGTLGTKIATAKWEYVTRTVGNHTVNFVSRETRYVDEQGLSPLTTEYLYTFHANSLQIQEKTTVLPVISTGNNGNGATSTRVEQYDIRGNLIWSKDETGIIDYNEYSSVHGGIVKSIRDVQTSTGGFVNAVPSGWATISGAGKHLVTEYEYDALGRQTQTLGPKFDAVSTTNTAVTVRPASWTVYDDVNRRTMSASGYATLDANSAITGYTLNNPVSISIRNTAGDTTDQIQAKRASTSGKLLATDTFAQSSYISWTKNIYDSTGKQTATWQYISIPTSGTGTSGTNYLVTPINTSEDVSGNTCRNVAPDGTITRTVYDWRNNPIQTWIGTNDTGATDSNPSGNGGSNDMVLVTEREYGMSGGCGTCTGEKDKVRVDVLHPDAATIRVTEYQYDWRGRQIRTINDQDADGRVTYSLNTYDNQDRVVKSEQFLETTGTDRLLARTEMYYDERGRNWKTVQSIVNPTTGAVTGTIQSLQWFDAAGRVIKSQNSTSPRYSKTMYDSLGNAFKTFVVTGTESGYAVASSIAANKVLSQSETTYDLAGNPVMTVSAERLWNQAANGALTQTNGRFHYSAQWLDPAGRTFASADYGNNGGVALSRPATVPASSASVRVSKTNFDVNTGRVASTVDPGGRITQPVYDGLGRAFKTILPKPNPSSAAPEYVTEFDSLGRTVAQIDPFGNKIQTIYGNFGRIDATLDAKSNRTDYTYNRLGELIEQTDPMGRVTKFEYDDLGRRIKTILPKPTTSAANPVQLTKYNEHGLVAQEIDPLGHVTAMEYDGLGRMTAKVDTLNGRTEYTFDSEGKMLTLRDPVNNVTTYTYDDAGRVTQEKNALNKSRSFEYLAGGLVSKKTDRNGRIVTYTYDRFGNMTEEKWYSSTNVLQRTLAFTYDALGRMTQFTDPSGTHTMTFDDGDRNTQTVMQLTGLTPTVTFVNTFDLLNRRTQLATKIGTVNDFANTYSFDANSQVTSIVQQTQGGNAVSAKRIDYAWNAANQLTSKTTYASTGTTSKVFDTTYTYDGMGRMNLLKHANGSTVFANYDFGWDAASRITNFDFTALGATKKTAGYAYDNTDQLTGATYNAFQTNEAYQYDANGNRTNTGYATGTNNQLTNDGTFTYTYDDEGNRLTKKQTSNNATTTYTWDHRNRLVKVVTPTVTVNYAYDHLNRLTTRNSDVYVHDGWQIVLVVNASGVVQNRCFWGANQDELVAEESVSNVLWTLCDHLGSVRDVVNSSGTVLNHLEYNAFGKRTSATSSAASNTPLFAYTGKLFDGSIDLQWNINRWYDAGVGRWISEDPIGFKAGDRNLVRYVKNHPLFLLDMFGKQATGIRRDYPLNYGETWATLVLLFDKPDSDTIRIRPRVKRNDSESFRQSWNSQMMPMVPEKWGRDYFTNGITRLQYYRLDDDSGIWFYPNLSAVLNATSPRYGGWDPGKGVDNDFAAVLIHHYSVTGTLRTNKSSPLITAKWHSIDVTNASLYVNSHVAGSEQFLLSPQECGYYIIAFLYGDMFGMGSGVGPSDDSGWRAGDYLVVVKMEYVRDSSTYTIQKITQVKIPSEFLDFDWDTWNRNSSKTSE